MAINQTNALNTAVPGMSGLTGNASSYIKDLMAGRITAGERGAVYQAGAERGVLGGMPGSTGAGGSLFANNDLRTLGLMAGERQQQGLQGYLNLLQTVSGTIVPTAGQQIQSNQFQQDLGFRQNEADRSFGLADRQMRLNEDEYRQKYGPKEYSYSVLKPNYHQAIDARGRAKNLPLGLMFGR